MITHYSINDKNLCAKQGGDRTDDKKRVTCPHCLPYLPRVEVEADLLRRCETAILTGRLGSGSA